MFQTLVASDRAEPAAAPVRFLASLGLHAMAVAGAILWSGRAGQAEPRAHQSPIAFIVPPVLSEPRLSHGDPAPSRADPIPAPALPAPAIEVPALPPHAIPPVPEPSGPPARSLASLLGSRPSATAGTGELESSAPGAAFSREVVDSPVEVVKQGAVHYPPALEGAGVEGRVGLEYVVDTLGRAEPGSIRVIERAHPAFEAAAYAAVVESRYRPARLSGRPVRQLVRQRLVFRRR